MSSPKAYFAPTKAAERKAVEEEFLARLKTAIETSGLSYAEVGRRLGSSPATVSEWFIRRSVPSGNLLLHLPLVLGVSATWLLTGEGDQARKAVPAAESYYRGAISALTHVGEALRALRAQADEGLLALPETAQTVAEEEAVDQKALMKVMLKMLSKE